MTFPGIIVDNSVPVDTKIAFSFFDLGQAYEKRKRYELAIENYKKSLDYDEDLHFVKNNLDTLVEKLRSINKSNKTVNKFHTFGEGMNFLYW